MSQAPPLHPRDSMPGETSIALQALLVSLTPATHISADGHQDNSASSVSAPVSPSIAAGLTRHLLSAIQ